MKKEAEIKIAAREEDGCLFEDYEYSLGAVEPLPFHTHSEYQFSVSPNAVGTYLYRGMRTDFAAFTLGIIHSGERHAPSDKLMVENEESYRVMYVEPHKIMEAAREIGWRKNELPYFEDFLIGDRTLIAKYLALFNEENIESALSKDIKLLDFFTYLIGNFATNKSSKLSFPKHSMAVKRARAFLDANFLSVITLDELAEVAKVGKFYLCREFKRVVGISPHVYQNHLRVNFARKLLLQDKSAAEIAHELGFYDQSHFGKNFKRLVGITPQSYAARMSLSK